MSFWCTASCAPATLHEQKVIYCLDQWQCIDDNSIFCIFEPQAGALAITVVFNPIQCRSLLQKRASNIQCLKLTDNYWTMASILYFISLGALNKARASVMNMHDDYLIGNILCVGGTAFYTFLTAMEPRQDERSATENIQNADIRSPKVESNNSKSYKEFPGLNHA